MLPDESVCSNSSLFDIFQPVLFGQCYGVIHLILALSVADQLKTRRRNLVSAKVGLYSFIFMVIFEPFVILLHYIPIEVGKL